MADLAETYISKDLHTQIYDSPDTYIGGASLTIDTLPILNEEGKLIFKEVEYVPGLLKLFDEVLVNARDQWDRLSKTKTKHPVTEIKVYVDSKTVKVFNNGEGIDVAQHPIYKDPEGESIWIPQLLFGELLTSANYDKKDKTTGGKNGFGAKLTNIFSTNFSVKTLDHTRKLEWKQLYSSNMRNMGKGKTRKTQKKPYSEIEYTAEFTKFGITEYSEDMILLMKKRVYDVAMCTPDEVNVYYNDVKIDIHSLKDYAELMEHETPGVYSKIHNRWKIYATISDNDSFQQVSFVNGIATIKGGKHVDKIQRIICKGVAEFIKKKYKKDVPVSMIKNYLKLFVDSTINDPSFNSQSKEFLESPEKSFGSDPTINEDVIKAIAENELAELVVQNAINKESIKAAKNTDGKKKGSLKGIPLLDDANKAGGREAHKCTLILTEGNSAKTMAVAGLSEIGKDYYGVFPLKGKVLNVKDTSDTKIADNKEITNIKKIMGLQKGRKYENTKDLRYGRIMIMTDQDHDGSHIKGLILNLFHREWYELFKNEDFICSLATPIVKAIKGQQEKWFYNQSDYNNWFAQNPVGWNIKYYKGLGTSTAKEAKEYFKNMKVTNYTYEDIISNNSMSLAFSKDQADKRKDWLKEYNPDNVHDSCEKISHKTFVDRELIHFSNDDCLRSIPHIIDGLKPSQRKVLFACFKKGCLTRRQEVRVAQLAAYTSEHAMYHHGEASLQGTITGMAQDFTGSNNINLLFPQGQFGSRILGGADAAQPRYIHTFLEKLTPILFPKEDYPVLKYLDDDGHPVEPVHYTPIIPLILVNGCNGIGTGYSSKVPQYNPINIANNLLNKINEKPATSPKIHYNGFTGKIKLDPNDNKRYITTGVHKIIKGGVRITELPVGTWTQNYKTFLDDSIMEKTKDNKIKGFILSFTDNSTDTLVDFTIRVKPDLLATWCENRKILKDLKLTSSVRTSNMHLYFNDSIKKYSDADQIMDDFYKVRLNTYKLRKDYMINVIKNTIIRFNSKKRYIEEINDSVLILKNKTKQTIIKELMDRKYPISVSYKFKDKWELNNPFLKNLEIYQEPTKLSTIKNGYDYLLNISTIQLSLDNKTQLDKLCLDKQKELETIEHTEINDMWIKELNHFKTEYKKFQKNKM